MCCKQKRGFTLIELLIVVLIIGILSAIAVPQYQKAVLKSRFSSLMPTTQAIRDGNEMYYMTNGRYADDVTKLDITAANTEDMTLTLNDDLAHVYTMATRPNLKNNLIMYQKHSLNFPGEIHCEALKGNKHANWLCKTALHGNLISGSITSGYNTYILEGTNKGVFGEVALLADCDNAISLGYTCDLTTDESGKVTQKKVCGDNGVCSIFDYDANGYKRTTCQLNENDVCESKKEYTYDAAGNKLTERNCQTAAPDGSCAEYGGSGRSYTYDENGNKLTERFCQTVAPDGSCSLYAYGGNYDYTYDAKGNRTSERICWRAETDGSCPEYENSMRFFTYDTNGNMLTDRYCQVGTSGACSSYYSWDNHDYTYDENGNILTQRFCQQVGTDGGCWYGPYGNYDYTYDAKGNMLSKRGCLQVGTDGSCSEYNTSGNVDYTYDTNGNKLTERSCQTVASDGSCSEYGGSGANYTYDANGNMTSQRHCQNVAADGSCAEYSQNGNTDYTYDTNGNMTSKSECKTVAPDGSCQVGSFSHVYTYDANGNVTSDYGCSTGSSDGSCTEYWGQIGTDSISSSNNYMYDDEGNKVFEKGCKIWSGAECVEWFAPTYY